MKAFLRVAVVAAAVVVFSGCEDRDLRQWMQGQYEYTRSVGIAVCQLEADVYDVADSAGDTRTAGNAGDNRLCPSGHTGDPPGLPDEPPPL